MRNCSGEFPLEYPIGAAAQRCRIVRNAGNAVPGPQAPQPAPKGKKVKEKRREKKERKEERKKERKKTRKEERKKEKRERD